MKRLVGYSRFLVIIGVIGFAVLSVTTFVWAGAKTVLLIDGLLEGGWRKEYSLVKLLQVVDTFLMAVVQLIVALGLYELFIGEINLPDWLIIHSFDDLKKSVIDVLVVFVSIKGIEVLFSDDSAADNLRSVGAVGILIVALTLFRFKPAKFVGKGAAKGD